MSNKKRNKKSKTLSRIVTLILGLGFAGSTLAIALSSVFSQNDYSASNSDNSAENPSVEEQIQLQIGGYEKVLAREPKNFTALNGLAEIYLQTGQPEKAVPTLEKLVEYYPEQQEYASLLELIKQQRDSQPQSETSPETVETE
ncbi:MAG: tetratricopeptide repeat protein [Cyanobacteria bacterium P01_A01_bin.83]